jgi:hypothetical protein
MTQCTQNSIIRRFCYVYRSLMASVLRVVYVFRTLKLNLIRGRILTLKRVSDFLRRMMKYCLLKAISTSFPTLIALTLIIATVNEDKIMGGSSINICIYIYICVCVCVLQLLPLLGTHRTAKSMYVVSASVCQFSSLLTIVPFSFFSPVH